MDYNKCLEKIMFKIIIHNKIITDHWLKKDDLEYKREKYKKSIHYVNLLDYEKELDEQFFLISDDSIKIRNLVNLIIKHIDFRKKWTKKKKQITKPFLEFQLDNFMCKDIRNIVMEYLIKV